MRVVVFVIFISVTRCGTEDDDICGVERSPASEVFEGASEIERFPWLGLLIYSYGSVDEEPLTASVVLITKDIALATALEIDKFPKVDFRRNSRVILGHNCSGPYLKVMEYVYHPEYRSNYYSALAMVQLQASKYLREAMPICSAIRDFEELNVYAMTLTHDCSKSMVRIYEMKFVPLDQCKDYYRRNDLDVESLWPRHVACAQSTRGGNCLWRSGTVLVSKQNGRWHLLGVGVYGPGCEAPARFLEYSEYHGWVEKALNGIGKVALTRMASDHVILRRSGWKIQKWGPCDEEEKEYLMFTDHTIITPQNYYKDKANGTAKYNLTLNDEFEYSCVIARVWYLNKPADVTDKAELTLTRACPSKIPYCAQSKYTSVNFYIFIKFNREAAYILNVYGKSRKSVHPKHVFFYINQKLEKPKLPWPDDDLFP